MARRHELDCSCISCIIKMRSARTALAEVIKEFRESINFRKKLRPEGDQGWFLERKLRAWEELSKPPKK